MSQITINVPESIQSYIDRQIEIGEFANAEDYFLALAAKDLNEADIDRLVEEAEEDFANGNLAVFEKGAFIEMGHELIRQRLTEKGK